MTNPQTTLAPSVQFRLQIHLQQSLPQVVPQFQPFQPTQQQQPHIHDPKLSQPQGANAHMAQIIQLLQLVQQLNSHAQPSQPTPTIPMNSTHQFQPTHQPAHQPTYQPAHQPAHIPNQSAHQPVHQHRHSHIHQHMPARQQYQRRFRPYHVTHDGHPEFSESSHHVTNAPTSSFDNHTLLPEVPKSAEPASHVSASEATPLAPPSSLHVSDEFAPPTAPKRTEFKQHFTTILHASDEAQAAWRAFRDARTPCTIARGPCFKVYRAFCEEHGGELRDLVNEAKFEKLGTVTTCGCSSA